MAVTFLLAFVVAVCVWLLLPKWSRNVNLTPLCENCEHPEDAHSGTWCRPGWINAEWSPSDPREWKKGR